MSQATHARERRAFTIALIVVIVVGVTAGPFIAATTAQPWWVFLAQVVAAVALALWYQSMRKRSTDQR